MSDGINDHVEKHDYHCHKPASPSQSGESESGLLKAAIKADAVLSLLRHRQANTIRWGTVGIPTESEVDQVIGELRRAIINAERKGGQQ